MFEKRTHSQSELQYCIITKEAHLKHVIKVTNFSNLAVLWKILHEVPVILNGCSFIWLRATTPPSPYWKRYNSVL